MAEQKLQIFKDNLIGAGQASVYDPDWWFARVAKEAIAAIEKGTDHWAAEHLPA